MQPSTINSIAGRRRLSGQRLIRQLHLWIGAWGAIAAILFGFTGFVQNHRAQLRLPQGESTELSKVEIEVPESARASPEALRDWLRESRRVPVEAIRAQPARAGELNGAKVRQPSRWLLSGGNARVTWSAEYTPGNATVEVRNTEQSPLAVLLRLHKGVGGGIAWILLTDSFALAMVALGMTGLLLWGRGRSAKQLVFSAVGAAIAVVLVIGAIAIA